MNRRQVFALCRTHSDSFTQNRHVSPAAGTNWLVCWLVGLFFCFLFHFLLCHLLVWTQWRCPRKCRADLVERIMHSCLHGWNCASSSQINISKSQCPGTQNVTSFGNWVLQIQLVKMRPYWNRAGPNPRWENARDCKGRQMYTHTHIYIHAYV